MPKTLKELKIFKEGLISNLSALDIPDEAAAYSENVNPEGEGGAITGIASDRVLSNSGFSPNPTPNTYTYTVPAVANTTEVNQSWHERYIITGEVEKEFRTIIAFSVGSGSASPLTLEWKQSLANHTVLIGGAKQELTDLVPWDSANNTVKITEKSLYGISAAGDFRENFRDKLVEVLASAGIGTVLAKGTYDFTITPLTSLEKEGTLESVYQYGNATNAPFSAHYDVPEEEAVNVAWNITSTSINGAETTVNIDTSTVIATGVTIYISGSDSIPNGNYRVSSGAAPGTAFDLEVTTTVAGTAQGLFAKTPFGVPLGDLITTEGNGTVVKATDIGVVSKNLSSDLVLFDAKTNKIGYIEDINNSNDNFNSIIETDNSLSHDGSATFVNFNQEMRIGLGSGKNSKSLWAGKIDNRSQLGNSVEGFHVVGQEADTIRSDLSGFNFAKVLVPYLPPADEMGKRWYQSQVIDMKQGAGQAGATTFERPAYQAELQTSNLGNVVFLGTEANVSAFKTNFDKTHGTELNRFTLALNNKSTSAGEGYATDLIPPFVGCTFVVGVLPGDDSMDASDSESLNYSKKRYWNNTCGDEDVIVGDVFMIKSITFDGEACHTISFVYMGNVAQSDADATETEGGGFGPAFCIGLPYGGTNLTWVNLHPRADTTDTSIALAGIEVDSKPIPLGSLLSDSNVVDICAIGWNTSRMEQIKDSGDTNRKINKKYGTLLLADKLQREVLYRVELFDFENPIIPVLSTDDGVSGGTLPKITLSFGKIPLSLKEEGMEIVSEHERDTGWVDESWERIPKDSHISDILDTWNRRDADTYDDSNGDGSDFNYIANHGDTGNVEGSWEPNGSYLTWVMYSKNTYNDTHTAWDMFLYNYEASGHTKAEDGVWLDPLGNGRVYIKDRTPPYQACYHAGKPHQTSNPHRTMYFPRGRFALSHHGGNENYLFQSSWHAGDGQIVAWRHNRNNDGINTNSAWVECSSRDNESHPENMIRPGNNLGWLTTTNPPAPRQIQMFPGTLVPYEPRFECFSDYSGSAPVVAHGQGHRVLFSGKVTGTFVKSGGRMKPSEGWDHAWDDWGGFSHHWWSFQTSGTTENYTSDLCLFTVKEISVKTYLHPTDHYESGGERELGGKMFGGNGTTTDLQSNGSLSVDSQNTDHVDSHTRSLGDYIYINRTWCGAYKDDNPGTNSNNNIVTANVGTTDDNFDVDESVPCFVPHVNGNSDNKYYERIGCSTLHCDYWGHSDGTTGANITDLTGTSAQLFSSILYEIDPLVTMQKFDNKASVNLDEVMSMETITINDDGDSSSDERHFKRLLCVNFKSIPEDENEGNKTVFQTFELNKHYGYNEAPAPFGGFNNNIGIAYISAHSDDNDAYLTTGEDGDLFEQKTFRTTQTLDDGVDGSQQREWTSASSFERGTIRNPGSGDSDETHSGYKIYENPRLIFANTMLHCQGLRHDPDALNDYNSNKTNTFTVHNPAIFGLNTSASKSIYTRTQGVAEVAGTDPDTDGSTVLHNPGGSTSGQTRLGAVNGTSAIDLWPDDESRLKSINILTLNETDSLQGEGFDSGSIIYYKFSLTYDGFQESPLTDFTVNSNSLSNSYKQISLDLSVTSPAALGLSPRVTNLNVYWTDDIALKPYTLAKSIFLDINKDPSWFYNTVEGRWDYILKHTNTGATYETLNGIPGRRKRTMVNWGLGTMGGPYLFVGDVSHPLESEDITNYIYRSKPNKPDMIDWVNDSIIMPTKPIALAAFKGRLYAWDRNNTYVINQEGMFIEDVYKGIGILNKKAVVVTDYGMCFADANNIYLHDGVSPKAIGNPILRNTLKRTWRVGWIRAVEIAQNQGHDINVFYDGPSHSFVVTTKGFCQDKCEAPDQMQGSRGYAFNLLNKRWDYWSIPSVKSYTPGDGNTVYLGDGYFVYSHKTDHAESKDWQWYSKNMTMGSDTQLKVFNKIKLAGSPSSVANTDVKCYIDDKPVHLTIENKHYSLTSADEIVLSEFQIDDVVTSLTYSGTNSDRTYSPRIRKGMYVKLGGVKTETIFITDDTLNSNGTTTITFDRAQLGSIEQNHSGLSVLQILAPSFRIPSGQNKGKKIRVELLNQRGMVDSIGIIWRAKGLK